MGTKSLIVRTGIVMQIRDNPHRCIKRLRTDIQQALTGAPALRSRWVAIEILGIASSMVMQEGYARDRVRRWRRGIS